MNVCKRGHELTPENSSIQLGGSGKPYLMCRKCNADRAKRWRQKNAHRLGRKAGNGWGRPGETLICR